MKRFVKLYGASPLHLLAVLASLALAGYAAQFLLEKNTFKVVIWLVGAAVLHDLLLVPLYALADRSITGVWRRSSSDTEHMTVPWLNYVRFPAVVSGLLLLVYWPAISRRNTRLEVYSNLSTHPYFGRWLLLTGALFLISAVAYAWRWRRAASAKPVVAADDARSAGA